MKHRETDVIEVHHCRLEHLRPERLRLQLDARARAFPIDIGSLAYTKRSKRDPRELGEDCPTLVESDSFVLGRRELIRRILESFSTKVSHLTILSNFKHYRIALDWCDQNNHIDAFARLDALVPAYQSFTQYLFHRVATGKINPASANKEQMGFRALGLLCFPNCARDLDAAVIKIPRSTTNSAKLPAEKYVLNYFYTSLAIARQLSSFVLDHKPYPFRYTHEGVVVTHFPTSRGTITNLSDRISPLYNHEELRISTVAEYSQASPTSSLAHIKQSVKSAQLVLESANSNARSPHRLNIASLAARAYMCALNCIIGSSPSEFLQFDFDEAIAIEQSPLKKSLSAIKFRANGKQTQYAIGRKRGIQILREYLKLRSWITNGRNCERLFFLMSGSGIYRDDKEFLALMPDFTWFFYQSISGIYISRETPNLTSTIIRKYKSSILHSLDVAPTDIAEVLNHKVSTNAAHYTLVRPEQQENELGNFWESVRSAAQLAVERAEHGTSLTSIAAGHCESINDPHSISSDKPIMLQPNCRTQLGCVYCIHYACHADYEDVHKLLSVQYVVNAIRRTAPDSEHAEGLFKDLSIRIEFILDSISNRDPLTAELVTRTRYKVNKLGELTKFWENRLQRYEHLGVVF